MNLPNTFIYPATAHDAAEQLTKIIEGKFILLFVIGQGDLHDQIVEEGDDQSQQMFFGARKKVIWLPDHKIERERCLVMLQKLLNFDPLHFDKVIAFSVKPVSDIAADVIFPEEVPDDITMSLRLKRAFAKAGIDPQTVPPTVSPTT